MENEISLEVKKVPTDLYFEFVKYLLDHSFTNDMMRYMLRELVALNSLICNDEQFIEIMRRFRISCEQVEPRLNDM